MYMYDNNFATFLSLRDASYAENEAESFYQFPRNTL